MASQPPQLEAAREKGIGDTAVLVNQQLSYLLLGKTEDPFPYTEVCKNSLRIDTYSIPAQTLLFALQELYYRRKRRVQDSEAPSSAVPSILPLAQLAKERCLFLAHRVSLNYKLVESRDLTSCLLLLGTYISIMPFAGIQDGVVNSKEHSLEHPGVDKEVAPIS